MQILNIKVQWKIKSDKYTKWLSELNGHKLLLCKNLCYKLDDLMLMSVRYLLYSNTTIISKAD